MTFKIVRFFQNHRKRTLATGLTEECRRYVKGPEHSSRTCTDAKGKSRTRRCGHWFDGYTKE